MSTPDGTTAATLPSAAKMGAAWKSTHRISPCAEYGRSQRPVSPARQRATMSLMNLLASGEYDHHGASAMGRPPTSPPPAPAAPSAGAIPPMILPPAPGR